MSRQTLMATCRRKLAVSMIGQVIAIVHAMMASVYLYTGSYIVGIILTGLAVALCIVSMVIAFNSGAALQGGVD